MRSDVLIMSDILYECFQSIFDGCRYDVQVTIADVAINDEILKYLAPGMLEPDQLISRRNLLYT